MLKVVVEDEANENTKHYS